MDRRDIEIIDTHVHAEPWFLSPDTPVPAPTCFDALYAECRHRTRLLVCSTGRGESLEREGNVAAVRKLAELIGPFPDKFIGAVMIDPHDLEGALEAVEIGVTQFGMRCVGEMVQYIHGYRTDGRLALPIVAKAVELNVPLDFHVSSEDHAEGLARLAEKFPRARLIAAHAAGGRSWRRGLDAVRHFRNVWVEIMAHADAAQIGAVIDAIGADRVLYGTDFGLHTDPELRYTAGNVLLDRLAEMELPAADVEAICSGNAKRVLGLDE